jgi:hypothetical protein
VEFGLTAARLAASSLLPESKMTVLGPAGTVLRNEKRTFSLRQTERALSAILMLGDVRSGLREEVTRMKITVEIDVTALVWLVLNILAYSAIR